VGQPGAAVLVWGEAPGVVVVVVRAFESLVGRMGAAAVPAASVVLPVLGVTVVVDVEAAAAETSGHSDGPQARLVGQQPPPRLAGQDW